MVVWQGWEKNLTNKINILDRITNQFPFKQNGCHSPGLKLGPPGGTLGL